MTAGSRVLRNALITTAALALTVSSCGREPTGPGGPNGPRLSQPIAFDARFPAAYTAYLQAINAANQASVQAAGGLANQVAGDAAVFTRVRIILRFPDGSIAKDTVIDFPPGVNEVPMPLSIKLPSTVGSEGVTLSGALNYLNAAGDIVWTAVGIEAPVVPSAPGAPPPKPVVVVPKYVGPGSSAVGVQITTPKPMTVTAGGSFTVAARAVDAGGNKIDNTPILFISENGVLAQVNALTGVGTAGPTRGTTRIVAQLLTFQEDAVTLTVRPIATTLALASGGGQIANVGTNLPNPVVVRVTAADGGPVDGVTVTFAAQNGGSVGTASAVTDANGNAQTTWRLGSLAAGQTMTATAAGLSGSPLTVNATGRAIDPVRLAFGQQPPATVSAGVPFLPPVTVQAVDATGAVTTAFAGPVTVALGAGAPPGASLIGTKTVNAVNGVATFADLNVTVPGTYTLVATNPTLTTATSTSFTIVAGAANRLAFQNYPILGAGAGATLDPVTVVVRDAFNNPVTSFAGPVTITANGPTAIAAAATEGAAASQAAPVAQNGDATPLANALIGTTTVNAVAGVATFSDLRLTTSGGYTFSASAPGLVGASGPSFGIQPGPATLLSLVSGGGQTTPGATPFANPIVVRVTDAFGNGVGGVSVSFTPVASTGNANPSSMVSDQAGFAQTVWTPIGIAGSKTLNVTGSGLTPSPLVVTGTATTSSGTLRTWTGATSTAFNVATNWSPAGVPGAADILTVPSTANAPVVSASIAVGSLTINPGVSFMNNATLTVGGSLVAGGSIAGSGTVVLTGTGTLGGVIHEAVTISGGVYTLTPGLSLMNGAFTITSGGKLIVGDAQLTATQAFATSAGGILDMQGGSGIVDVQGDVTFAGGNTTGHLTAGVFGTGGNFTATGSAFSASGSHILNLWSNELAQTLTFNSPVGGQGIQDLYTEGAGAKVISGSPNVRGSVVIDYSSAPITGPGALVTIGGSLFDETNVESDTQGAWRVDQTKTTGSGTIDAAYITTNLTIASGTLSLTPEVGCVECGLRAGLRAAGAALRTSGRADTPEERLARMVNLRRAATRMAQVKAYRAPKPANALANITGGGYLQVNGSVAVIGASAVLKINGASMDITYDFSTASGGRLDMTDDYGQLSVYGNADFAGGSTAGLLMAGQLTVMGDFTQSGGATDAFAASPDFYTYIGVYCYGYCGGDIRGTNGSRSLRSLARAQARAQARPQAQAGIRSQAPQRKPTAAQEMTRLLRDQKTKAHRDTIMARMKALDARRAAAFAQRKVAVPARLRAVPRAEARTASVLANYGSSSNVGFSNPGSSHFGTVYIQGGEVQLQSDLVATGRFESGYSSYHDIISATPHTVTSNGADVRDIYFSNTRWVIEDGDDIYDMDYVEFDNMSPTAIQFTVNRSGSDLEGGGYYLYEWSFYTVPTTGHYISVNDLGGPGNGTAAVEMYYPYPAVHGGHVATSGGGQIYNWAAAFLWGGTVNNDWFNGSNWSTGFVPYSDDDITIPAGTPFAATISNNTAYIRNITFQTGGRLFLDNGTLYTYGDVDAPVEAAGPSVACTGSGGSLYLFDGSSQHTVRGRFCNAYVHNGHYQVGTGNLLVVDNVLQVSGNGILTLAGGTAQVGGIGGTGAGTFYTYGNGVLVMNNAADQFVVGSGGAYFNGASTAGLLTAGNMTINNGCIHTLSGSASAFAPSGTHTVTVTGASNVEFVNVVSSYFQNLNIVAGSSLELLTGATVNGTLGRQGSGATTISSPGFASLTTSGLNFSSAAATNISNVRITLVDGTSNTNFGNVNFSGYLSAGGAAILNVNRTGAAVLFSALNFGTAGFSATSTEHFVSNQGSANLSILASNPASGTLGIHFTKPGSGAVAW